MDSALWDKEIDGLLSSREKDDLRLSHDLALNIITSRTDRY